MLPKPSLPQLTLSAWAWPSTSQYSTTRFSTRQIVHATLLSRLSMMLSLSSILCLRSHTVTALSSCNFSETTLPYGHLQIAASQRLHLPMHQRRPRRLLSPRRPRLPSQALRPHLQRNLRSLQYESPRLIFICFLILLEWLVYLACLRWSDCGMGRGWELI